MSAPASSRVAYAMAAAPLVLYLPVFWLSGIGPCTSPHPAVMLLAAVLFAGLAISSLRMFTRDFRWSIRSVCGIGLAALGLLTSVLWGYLWYAAEFM